MIQLIEPRPWQFDKNKKPRCFHKADIKLHYGVVKVANATVSALVYPHFRSTKGRTPQPIAMHTYRLGSQETSSLRTLVFCKRGYWAKWYKHVFWNCIFISLCLRLQSYTLYLLFIARSFRLLHFTGRKICQEGLIPPPPFPLRKYSHLLVIRECVSVWQRWGKENNKDNGEDNNRVLPVIG